FVGKLRWVFLCVSKKSNPLEAEPHMVRAQRRFQPPHLAAFFFFATAFAALGFFAAAGAGVVAGLARRGDVPRARGASPVWAPVVPPRALSSSTALSSVTCSGSRSVGKVALTPAWLT